MISSKTILITGASTGFGRDAAETLTREGHRVFASFRDIAGRNKSHADALRSKDINVVELDVTNNNSVETAVSSVVSQVGQKWVDIYLLVPHLNDSMSDAIEIQNHGKIHDGTVRACVDHSRRPHRSLHHVRRCDEGTRGDELIEVPGSISPQDAEFTHKPSGLVEALIDKFIINP